MLILHSMQTLCMHGALCPIIIIIIITTFILPGKKHIEMKNLFYKCVPAEINSNTAHVGLTNNIHKLHTYTQTSISIHN